MVGEWALLLAPEPPFPPAGGGAIRTGSVLDFLAKRYRVHLLTFRVGEGGAVAAEGVERLDWVRLPSHSRNGGVRMARNAWRLARGVLPLSDRFSGSQSRQQVARAMAGRRYEIAVAEHFWCATYVDLLREHSAMVILDLHNIESALHQHCSRSQGAPAQWAHRAFARIARCAEREWLPRFDLVLAASEDDRRRVQELAPGVRTAVYPNAISLGPLPEVAEEHAIAFSGNLEYHPNVAAVRYFRRRVWPALRERDLQLRWRLIGSNEAAVRGLVTGDPRIELTGAVEDAVSELARARLVVAPLLAGSGTRVKILEAWAAGRAVVSTRLGAEGLPAVDGENVVLADTPEQMMEAVLALLGDPARRSRLGRAGRRLVEERLSWPAAHKELERTLAACRPAAGLLK